MLSPATLIVASIKKDATNTTDPSKKMQPTPLMLESATTHVLEPASTARTILLQSSSDFTTSSEDFCYHHFFHGDYWWQSFAGNRGKSCNYPRDGASTSMTRMGAELAGTASGSGYMRRSGRGAAMAWCARTTTPVLQLTSASERGLRVVAVGVADADECSRCVSRRSTRWGRRAALGDSASLPEHVIVILGEEEKDMGLRGWGRRGVRTNS